jgi:hypothetical protein
MSFQKIFRITTTLRIIASFFDVIQVQRWNITYLGLNDHFSYLFGDSVIYPISYVFDFLPAVLITAKLTQEFHGSEAILYAVLAGFANFGQSVSGFVGAYLTEVFGIRTTKPKALLFSNSTNFTKTTAITTTALENSSTNIVGYCDFRNLSLLIIVAHAILPALTIPLIPILVPNMSADSSSVDTNNEDDDENDKRSDVGGE